MLFESPVEESADARALLHCFVCNYLYLNVADPDQTLHHQTKAKPPPPGRENGGRSKTAQLSRPGKGHLKGRWAAGIPQTGALFELTFKARSSPRPWRLSASPSFSKPGEVGVAGSVRARTGSRGPRADNAARAARGLPAPGP